MGESMFGLDMKDRKILFQLDKNARQSNSQIAKKVGLSTEVVAYRIKRFEERGVVTHYQTVLNLSKLGVIHFKIALSFRHAKSEDTNKALKKLHLHKKVKWIASCKGGWDMLIALEAKSICEIGKLKSEILSYFGDKISGKALSIGISASVFDRSFILDGGRPRVRTLIEDTKKIELDSVDVKILKSLGGNSRKPIVDIATELNSTARVVNYRIRQMMKSGLIQGFRIAIDYEKLGLLFYKGFVYLDNIKDSRVKDLIRYFELHPNIIHHVEVLGNWDMEPEFEVSSADELDAILTDMKDGFSDIIQGVDIITVSKEHKFVYY